MNDDIWADIRREIQQEIGKVVAEREALRLENNQLRAMLDNPHAVHAHYLRIGSGWEVWTSERVRGMERELEQLKSKRPELDFVIERRDGIAVIAWKSGGCRPATDPEVALWEALQIP